MFDYSTGLWPIFVPAQPEDDEAQPTETDERTEAREIVRHEMIEGDATNDKAH